MKELNLERVPTNCVCCGAPLKPKCEGCGHNYYQHKWGCKKGCTCPNYREPKWLKKKYGDN